MNNKVKGTAFERKMCNILSRNGYWVHFISPDNSGAQPFDIIAVKSGMAIAADCKTCVDDTFRIGRLEDNQIMAFERWVACGNLDPVIFVEHDKNIYLIPYNDLKEKRGVKLDEHYRWK